MNLVLASQSPRRQELLWQLGLDFRVENTAVQECAEGGSPEHLAEENARRKADYAAKRWPDALVIGADTLVVVGGLVLGKPATASEAEQMLCTLSGRQHDVITGVALRHGHSLEVFHVVTHVWFRSLLDYEIERYIQSGEPFDKAGAYGIQGIGGVFVERIDGCYFNVVGLPIQRLACALRGWGLDLFRA